MTALLPFTAFSEEKAEAETPSTDLKEISESFGHLIGKNLDSIGFDFDLDLVIKGIKDNRDGKAAPLDETKCVQAITHLQEQAFEKLAQDNLSKAEDFLKTNAKQKDVVEVEEGKLQYKVLQEGNGEEVQAGHSPLIRYKGTFLDGTVFGESKEEEKISLSETIPGFSKGIVGMKVGEKRTLYIHPDLGYGKQGYLPPNSSLIFEIEVVKADAPNVDENLTGEVDVDTSLQNTADEAGE